MMRLNLVNLMNSKINVVSKKKFILSGNEQ